MFRAGFVPTSGGETSLEMGSYFIQAKAGREMVERYRSYCFNFVRKITSSIAFIPFIAFI